MKRKTNKRLFNGWINYVIKCNSNRMIYMNNRFNSSLDIHLLYLKMIEEGKNGN